MKRLAAAEHHLLAPSSRAFPGDRGAPCLGRPSVRTGGSCFAGLRSRTGGSRLAGLRSRTGSSCLAGLRSRTVSFRVAGLRSRTVSFRLAGLRSRSVSFRLAGLRSRSVSCRFASPRSRTVSPPTSLRLAVHLLGRDRFAAGPHLLNDAGDRWSRPIEADVFAACYSWPAVANSWFPLLKARSAERRGTTRAET